MENSELAIHAKNIRKNILKMVYMAQSGHPGGALSIADILTFLYFEDMEVSVENPRWEAKQLFRFYRTQNVIGDINIREFHSKVRDTKCDPARSAADP